jgi:hypothetical protein
MSKQSQTGLTGSRKKTRGGVDSVDSLDGLRDCLATAAMLAGLLEASGKHPHSELLQPEIVSRAGTVLVAEMEQAEYWLDQLEAAR